MTVPCSIPNPDKPEPKSETTKTPRKKALCLGVLVVDFLAKGARISFSRFYGQGLPVYEGKNLGFYGEVLTPPTIWIDEAAGREKLLYPLRRQAPDLDDTQIPLDYEHYRFGFRRIARSTDVRTLYVSYLPSRVFAMYTLTTTVQHYFDGARFRPYMIKPEEMFLYACMASFVLDFVMRFQVSTSVTMFNAYSLPVPRLTVGNSYFEAIVPRAARLTCTTEEFAGLWVDVMGEPWDPSKGVTDPDERQALRDELDARVAHLYGLSRDEFDHILGTFPLVFPDNETGWARREAVLDVYEQFAKITKDWTVRQDPHLRSSTSTTRSAAPR